MDHDEPSIQLQHKDAPKQPSANKAPPSATSSDGRSGVFNFFGLPRELRDKIYEQPALFEHQRLPSRENDFLMKAKKLRTSLLLVNSQFKREYSERCDKQQVLCLRDHQNAITGDAKVTARDKAERWNMDFCLHEDYNPAGNIEEDISSLQEVLVACIPDYPNLRSLSIKLYLSVPIFDYDNTTAIREQISRVVDFPRVEALEVYRIGSLYRHKKASEPRTLLARWERNANTPLDFLDTPVAADGTESEWEAFEGEDFHDASSNGDSDEGQDDSDSASENNSSDDDEEDDDDHDSNDGGDFSNSGSEHQSSASDNDDENNSEDSEGENGDSDGGDESNDPSDIDGAVDARPQPPTSYFDFFGLPRELRNMIYDQPGMLKEQTFTPFDNASKDGFAVKPRESFLRVSHQFNEEYIESCGGRLGVYFSADIYEFDDPASGAIPEKAMNEARFLHVRVGDLFIYDQATLEFETGFVKRWVAQYSSRMPKLKTVTMQIYMNRLNEGFTAKRETLGGLLMLDKLDLCQIILMKDSRQWESTNEPKKLLLQWKRGGCLPPPFYSPPLNFVEPCCKRTVEENDPHRHDEDDWQDITRGPFS